MPFQHDGDQKTNILGQECLESALHYQKTMIKIMFASGYIPVVIHVRFHFLMI